MATQANRSYLLSQLHSAMRQSWTHKVSRGLPGRGGSGEGKSRARIVFLGHGAEIEQPFQREGMGACLPVANGDAKVRP